MARISSGQRRWFRLMGPVSILLGMVCHLNAIGSFDFLTTSTTARSVGLAGALVSKRGTMEGLWNNPAGVAGLPGGVGVLLGLENHMGIHVLNGGLGVSFPHGGFALGASGLSLGTVTGDAQFIGDAPRTLPSGSLGLTSDLAFSPSSLFGWKIGLDLGVALSYAVETLDQVKLEGLFTSLGATVEVPFGSRWALRAGIAIRNLPLFMVGAPGFESPVITSPALSMEWEPGPPLRGHLGLQGDIRASGDVEYSMGTEWVVGRLLTLRGGYRFGPDGGFTFGAGFNLELPGKVILSLDLGQMVQTGIVGGTGFTGRTALQIRTFLPGPGPKN